MGVVFVLAGAAAMPYLRRRWGADQRTPALEEAAPPPRSGSAPLEPERRDPLDFVTPDRGVEPSESHTAPASKSPFGGKRLASASRGFGSWFESDVRFRAKIPTVSATAISSGVRLPWADRKPIRVELETHVPQDATKGAAAPPSASASGGRPGASKAPLAAEAAQHVHVQRTDFEAPPSCFRMPEAGGLEYSSQVNDYQVDGVTKAQLAASATQRIPYRTGEAAGVTVAQATFAHDGCVGDSGGYRLLSPRIILDVQIWVPQWADAGSSPIGPDFERFRDCIVAHEHTHESISVDFARNFQQEASQIPPADSCQAMSEVIQELFNRDYAEMRSRNAAFDSTTYSGQPCRCEL